MGKESQRGWRESGFYGALGLAQGNHMPRIAALHLRPRPYLRIDVASRARWPGLAYGADRGWGDLSMHSMLHGSSRCTRTVARRALWRIFPLRHRGSRWREKGADPWRSQGLCMWAPATSRVVLTGMGIYRRLIEWCRRTVWVFRQERSTQVDGSGSDFRGIDWSEILPLTSFSFSRFSINDIIWSTHTTDAAENCGGVRQLHDYHQALLSDCTASFCINIWAWL